MVMIDDLQLDWLEPSHYEAANIVKSAASIEALRMQVLDQDDDMTQCTLYHLAIHVIRDLGMQCL